jgi:hypothetical protein
MGNHEEAQRCAPVILFLIMQTAFNSRPAFPPVDDALAALARIDWRNVAQQCLTVALVAAAACHAISARAWANRGRLAPMLRNAAAALDALAARLPEPLSAQSPRPALIAALIDSGCNAAMVRKANRQTLISRARKAGLIA